MRILLFTENREKKDAKEIAFLEDNLQIKIDFFTNLEEAEYCAEIRHYDIVYIEYMKKYHNKYHNILSTLSKKNNNCKVFMLNNGESLKDFEKYSPKEESLDLNIRKHLILILPENETEIIKRENLIINVKKKTIFYEKEGEMIEIVFKKEFDFSVFLYFIRNYESIINISNLLDATCSEPEYTKDSLVEASISSIRKTFFNLFEINPIKAFKKVGYRFSLGV